jgi:hypothetical protein
MQVNPVKTYKKLNAVRQILMWIVLILMCVQAPVDYLIPCYFATMLVAIAENHADFVTRKS